MTLEVVSSQLEKRKDLTNSMSPTNFRKRDFDLELLEISLIRTDGGTQPRAGLNQDVLEEYSKAMGKKVQFPPVTVFYDGTCYWLADGFHRLEAAKKVGASVIAVDLRQGDRRDAIFFSVGANANHGLRRSNADKRRAVLTLLSDSEWCRWANRAIAEACGVDEGLVRLLKSELSADNPPIQNETFAKKCGVEIEVLVEAQSKIKSLPQESVAQRNGKVYTIKNSRMGKGNDVVAPKKALNSEKEISAQISDNTSEPAESLQDTVEVSAPVKQNKECLEDRLIQTIQGQLEPFKEEFPSPPKTSSIASPLEQSALVSDDACLPASSGNNFEPDSSVQTYYQENLTEDEVAFWVRVTPRITSKILGLQKWSDEEIKRFEIELNRLNKEFNVELNLRRSQDSTPRTAD